MTGTINHGQRSPSNTESFGSAHGTYAQFQGSRLHNLRNPEGDVSPLQEFIHDSFRALVLNPRFACVVAKGAFHRGSYRTGLYGDLASPDATSDLAGDLARFIRDQDDMEAAGEGFSTFVASFTGPGIFDEEIFERLLWQQLQSLHETDSSRHDWDASVSSNPEDSSFAFSFGGRAFYIIAMHPAASRWNRRFAWPTLVFNAHRQFDQLRADGRYVPIQTTIRLRDRALQGSTNAMLADFGERSEARQYSGRAVDDSWRCPFHAQHSLPLED